jgi:hypothetical protein
MSNLHPGCASRRILRERERIEEEGQEQYRPRPTNAPPEWSLGFDTYVLPPALGTEDLTPAAIEVRRKQRIAWHSMSPVDRAAYNMDGNRRLADEWAVAEACGYPRIERPVAEQVGAIGGPAVPLLYPYGGHMRTIPELAAMAGVNVATMRSRLQGLRLTPTAAVAMGGPKCGNWKK